MDSILHPTIGRIAGNSVEGCTQFLGIKYATLADRFATAAPIRYSGGGLDATNYGPQVTSPPGAVDMEFNLIQHTLPKPEFPGISDTDGLTLNITVPRNGTEPIKGLPVLVFLHGGGFQIGGNWWPQYDFAKLVRLSSKLGHPIIGININYRLGLPGFFTCPELRAAGYKPNNGLRDQKMALKWIRENIEGFGGNPEDLTVMGESAGGVSTGYLLLSEEPLAKRLICLGGCPPLLGQLPIEAGDQIAKACISSLGLEDVPSSDLVRHLLELPAEHLLEKVTPATPMLPIVDGDVIPRRITLDDFENIENVMPGVQWIDSFLTGYSMADGSIMAYMGLFSRKEGIAAAFRESATKTLGDYPDCLASILDHYSLGESATSKLTDDEALMNIIKFITDVAFFMPAIEIAANFPKDSFVLTFNEPNPWDGPFKGSASHILDVAFLFQNYNESLSDIQKGVAEQFGTDIIMFMNNKAPWKAFNKGKHGVALYTNGRREYHEPPSLETTGQSPFIVFLGKDKAGPGMQRLMQVFTDFMEG